MPPRSDLSPEATGDYGSTDIYLEPALVLRGVDPTPVPTVSVPEIFSREPVRITPTAPQAPGSSPGTPLVTERGPIHNVNITFYDCANDGFCEHMYGGEWVYEGAAACSWNLPIGAAFYVEGDPTQRIYVCKDRGLLANTWVDIFWYYPSDGYEWQSHVGRLGTIHVVYLP